MLGTLRAFATELSIDRSSGGSWRSFHSVFELGLHHIAEGTDHLLFLLVLLLPAPLLTSGRKWAGYGGWRHSVFGLTKIVTAFTLGHSITLIVGTVGLLQLSSRLVEIVIAASTLVSAVHAFRPIFPGREPMVSALFGLVHGLAFATVLREFRLDGWHTANALLAFNLGIECMQLVVVLITVPWLVLLSRTSWYPNVRILGAAIAILAAIGWIVERGFNYANPLSHLVDSAATKGIWIIVALAALAIVATIGSRIIPASSRN